MYPVLHNLKDDSSNPVNYFHSFAHCNRFQLSFDCDFFAATQPYSDSQHRTSIRCQHQQQVSATAVTVAIFCLLDVHSSILEFIRHTIDQESFDIWQQ